MTGAPRGPRLSRRRHPLHCIVPPHILIELAVNGDEEDRRRALDTLTLDASYRMERLLAGVAAAPAQRVSTSSHKQRQIHTANNTTTLPGALVRAEGQGPSGDVAVDEAYDGLGATYDLMFEVYQRDSLDNNGMPLVGSVHYGQKYDNAAWTGQQMLFGDGDGKYFNRFTAAIDVMGHELAHGITQHERNLEYRYQPGALNEHCSDVVGSMVKQYSQSPRQTSAQADWIIGAGLFTSAVNGVGLRSMKAPGTAYDDKVLGKDPQPDHMSKYVNTESDSGGVHINSGIPNRAFYLVATALGGFSWERAGSIWYTTMRDTRLSSTASFADFAGLSADNAQRLYGASVRDSVVDAWRQVGIALGGGGGLSGPWILHYSWGCSTSYGQLPLTFNSNGTFTGSLAGQWRLLDGTVLLSFDSGPARYGGTLVGNVASGEMSTFAGSDGCWYLTKQGISGVAAG